MKKMIISVIFCIVSTILSTALSFEIEGKYTDLVQKAQGKDSEITITETSFRNESTNLTVPITFFIEMGDIIYFKFSTLEGNNFLVFTKTKNNDVVAVIFGELFGNDIVMLEKN